MAMRVPFRVLVALMGLGVARLPAQTTPDVAEILKKISATYKVDRYEIDIAYTARKGSPATSHVQISFSSPNRYRMQGNIPGVGMPQVQLISDGETLSMYDPASGQYASGALKEIENRPGDLPDIAPQAMDHYFMWRYRGATDFKDTAKFVREETIAVGGQNVPCYVLDLQAQRLTWWVDKTQFRILREDSDESSGVFAWAIRSRMKDSNLCRRPAPRK
jgi:outer membrane lipoprotein-sorting protein